MAILSIDDLLKARRLHKRRVFGGLSISVETRKGAKRRWHDPHSGESGSTTMLYDYGYIRGSLGSDGDHVDVYVGPHEDATHAYVIDQMKKPDFERFDEQKVMLGFKSAADAKKAYLAHYNDARFFGCMNAIPFAEFATKVLATKDSSRKLIVKSGGPFVGPKGGLWADAAHTIPWREAERRADHPFAGREVEVYESSGSKSRQPPGAIMDVKAAEIVGAKHLGRVKIPASGGVRSTAVADLAGVPVSPLDEKNTQSIVRAHVEGVKLPPIKIEVHSNGFVSLIDGHHRLAEARASGRKEIDVDWFFRKSEPPTERFIMKSASPPGGGWQSVPGGHRGGFRRRGHGGGWEYWYPGGVPTHHGAPHAAHAEKEQDTDPLHWEFSTPKPGMPPVAWTAGGVNPHDGNAFVKEAGVVGKLYRIKDPFARDGWATLTDVKTGEERLVQHDRVMPVRWVSAEERKARAAARRPQEPQQKWDPTSRRQKPDSGGTATAGARMPSFPDSRAKPGTETHKLENGHYPWRQVVRYEADADGKPRKIERTAPGISDSGKVALIAEYEPLIATVAKRVKNSFALKSRFSMMGVGQRAVDETLVDLRQAGMEGLLRGLDAYKPVGPLAQHLSRYVRDYTRLHAAREFAGGISLPHRHSLLLASYIGARAEAARVTGDHDPGPETVAQFWRPKKRELHDGLSSEEGSTEIPMGSYQLRKKVVTTDPESGSKKTQVVGTDVHTQPGKVEWAEQFHRFLVGQGGIADIDEQDALFPGLSVGSGLGADERIAVRQAMQRALPALQGLTVKVGPQAQYRGDAGKAIDLTLGLSTGEPMPIDEVVKHVPIEGSRGGAWSRTGTTQAKAAITSMIREGLEKVARHLRGDEDRASSLATALIAKVAPPEPPLARGPTMRERIRAAMARVPQADVRRWREETRAKYAEHPEIGRRLSRVSDSEVRRRIIEERIATAPLSPEMHRAMLATVTAHAIGRSPSGETLFTLTNPNTGTQRHVRVHSLAKSDDHSELDSAKVWEWYRFPELSRLRWASDDPLVHAPSLARAKFDSLLGL